MKLHYLAIAAVTVISANIGAASAASLRGIVATSDADASVPVLAADKYREDSWDDPYDGLDLSLRKVEMDDEDGDPDDLALLFETELMSQGGGEGGGKDRKFSGGGSRNKRDFKRRDNKDRKFRRDTRDFKRRRDYDSRDFKRRRDYDSRDFKRGSNPDRICRELYGRDYRYSDRLEECVPDF